MSDIFGLGSPRQFARFDPDASCWKTWPDIGLWGSDEYSQTWPKHGTTRHGEAFELATLAHHIAVSDCSSLLPTPTANLAINGGSQPPAKRRSGGHGVSIADVVEHLLPIPNASDANGAGPHGDGDKDLRTSIMLLPTPDASVANDGESPSTWLARREAVKAKRINGNGMGMPLSIAVQLLPTPTVADSRATRNATARRTRIPPTGLHGG